MRDVNPKKSDVDDVADVGYLSSMIRFLLRSLYPDGCSIYVSKFLAVAHLSGNQGCAASCELHPVQMY